MNENAGEQSRLNVGSLGEGGYRKTSRALTPHPSEGGRGGNGRAHNQMCILSRTRVL